MRRFRVLLALCASDLAVIAVGRALGAVSLVALTLSTCARSTAPRSARDAGGGLLSSGGDAALAVTQDAGPDAAATTEMTEVLEAVRREDWSAARQSWERLPEARQRSREGRYVGARVLLRAGDTARALPLLEGLDALLPALAVDILRHRAGALARLTRHAEAREAYGALYARTHAERDRAQMALEAQAAGDNAAAATVMRSWAQDAPSGVDRARAWRAAAQVLEATGDREGALAALRKVLVEEPDSGAATEAQAALARLGAALTPEETLSRAANLNERARYTQSIAELTAMPAGAGRVEARRMHLLGRALFYARNRYADAHTTLAAAANAPENGEREEDAFLSARALARSDRDDEAVRAYDEVARTVRGRWGAEAAFRAAWIVARQAGQAEAGEQRWRTLLDSRTDATEQQRAEASWELGWLLYRANRYDEAAAPLLRSSQLSTRALEQGRGRYWSAVSALRAGRREDAVRAFRAYSAERPLTYYALLGEARLRSLGERVEPPREAPARRPTLPVALPDAVRWLRALGFEREGGALLAGQEERLRAGLPADRADEALCVTWLELGEAHRAYTLAQRHGDLLDRAPTAETRWAWDCAYPRPWAHAVEAAEDASGLPRHYLFAIMRQESAFNPRDVSNARAMGLLQMIPPTTRTVARTLGIEFREEMLYDPAYNVRVGGWYIGRLFAQYRGVLPRAIGSFNAGPGAMGRWVQRYNELELDAFAETIPYDETRTYVRRVQQNLARYRYLYGPTGAGWPLELSLSAQQGVDNLIDY